MNHFQINRKKYFLILLLMILAPMSAFFERTPALDRTILGILFAWGIAFVVLGLMSYLIIYYKGKAKNPFLLILYKFIAFIFAFLAFGFIGELGADRYLSLALGEENKIQLQVKEIEKRLFGSGCKLFLASQEHQLQVSFILKGADCEKMKIAQNIDVYVKKNIFGRFIVSY